MNAHPTELIDASILDRMAALSAAQNWPAPLQQPAAQAQGVGPQILIGVPDEEAADERGAGGLQTRTYRVPINILAPDRVTAARARYALEEHMNAHGIDGAIAWDIEPAEYQVEAENDRPYFIVTIPVVSIYQQRIS